MKIFAVSNAGFTNKFNSVKNNSQPIAPSVQLSQLNKDTVSFKGSHCEICDSFGMITPDDDTNVNDFFDIKQTENKIGNKTLDTFVWNYGDKQVRFYGNELTLSNNIKKDKAKDLEIFSDENFNYIQYESNDMTYDLKYDKRSHQLVIATATTKKNYSQMNLQEFVLEKSRNKKDRYIAHYSVDSDTERFGRAFDRTHILFDKDMNVAKTSTSKKFNYATGGRSDSNFVKTYDDRGSVVDKIETDAKNYYNLPDESLNYYGW